MDVVISQYDKEYLEALIRYNKALAQRNTLLKSEFPVEEELFLVWEEMMSQAGEIVFRKREAFIREFIPIFQSFYSFISQDKEAVGLSYESHARDASLLEVLKQSRERDKIMGFSLRGIHKDELNMLLGEFPIKKEGSQGQNKTYLVALKLAQFDFLKRTGRTVPLLLLDDIFDKLDASRVEQIVKLVGGDNFGQIFITDTNRGHPVYQKYHLIIIKEQFCPYVSRNQTVQISTPPDMSYSFPASLLSLSEIRPTAYLTHPYESPAKRTPLSYPAPCSASTLPTKKHPVHETHKIIPQPLYPEK
jgi:recombinational DNA repair ATPase RecF